MSRKNYKIKIKLNFRKNVKVDPHKECLVCAGKFGDKCDPFERLEITGSSPVTQSSAITSVLWGRVMRQRDSCLTDYRGILITIFY